MSDDPNDAYIRRVANATAERALDLLTQVLEDIERETGVELTVAITVYNEQADYGNAVSTIPRETLVNLFRDAVAGLNAQRNFENRPRTHDGSMAVN